MKHLIETTDLSSLPITRYDRIILDSTKNEIVYRGGVKYEYVDLGLPSGLKWAKCNVGAETETDYGDYFMWGSVTPNTNTLCYWGNAPFNNGSSDYDEEYFTTHKSEWLDDNGNLKPEFDAARAIMGSDWRMPTKTEFQEFLDNTTELRVLNHNGTGVNGRKFTSKSDTSKYIFIPDAGYRESGLLQLQNSQSFVWSSSLDASSLYYAWCLNNYPDYVDNYRYYGMSVRGVRK